MTADDEVLSLEEDQRRDIMKAPDEVSAMLRLKALGWGSKRIAAELGCARNTVRRWLTEGDWRACASASRSKKLDGLSDWITERFHRHAGNADVVRQIKVLFVAKQQYREHAHDLGEFLPMPASVSDVVTVAERLVGA